MIQEELQRLRGESSDVVRERDRLKEDILTLENNCSEKAGEIDRLNKQLEAISAELKVNEVLPRIMLLILTHY